MKLKFVFPVLMLLCVICNPLVVFAGVVAPTPIDGGLSLLIAAGVGYGVKKVRDERKRKREEEEINK
jgi:hypothetical protein